jgi:hypothetical protein
MSLAGWKPPAILSRNAHLRPTHIWKAVEGLTQVGTVTEEMTTEVETQKLLKDLVSRLGLEPRALALKDRKDGFTQGLGFAKVSPFFFAIADLMGFY